MCRAKLSFRKGSRTGGLVVALWLAVASRATLAYGEDGPPSAPIPSTVDREYADIIAREGHDDSRRRAVEQAIGGAAALAIGLYGYYNDDRGNLTLFAYSATQTAGIVVLGDAIRKLTSPDSMLIVADRHLSQDHPDVLAFKRDVIRHDREERRSRQKMVAYTSTILGSLYAYNGVRSRGDMAQLRNAYYFLSFNMFLVAGGSFMQLWRDDGPKDGLAMESSLGLTPQRDLFAQFQWRW